MSRLMIKANKSPLKDIVDITITSDFGYRDFTYTNPQGQRVRVRGNHGGIDLVPRAEIVPIAKGRVKAVRKTVKGYDQKLASGNYVLIEHVNGEETFYCHLDYGSININIGDIVDTNTIIGTTKIRTTGNSTGLHLHFEVRIKGVKVDPKPYLKGEKRIFDQLEVNSNEYIVKSGDTLSKIGIKLGIPWQKIYIDNKTLIDGENKRRKIHLNKKWIYPGQKLRLVTDSNLKVGDKVNFIGNWDIYISSTSNVTLSALFNGGIINRHIPGARNEYHLKGRGWVRKQDIKKI